MELYVVNMAERNNAYSEMSHYNHKEYNLLGAQMSEPELTVVLEKIISPDLETSYTPSYFYTILLIF